jgi:hypothetical protein
MMSYQYEGRRLMAIGSEQRRRERRPEVEALFGPQRAEAALDLLHLADMAWHDCYPKDLAIDPDVLADILLCSRGDLAELISVAREAVIDFRDVRLAADALRAEQARERHHVGDNYNQGARPRGRPW